MSSDANELRFDERLKQYPLSFVIPAFIFKELEKRGIIPSPPNELRASSRFYCNGPVIVSCTEPLKVLEIKPSTTRGVVRNISKSGMSILVGQQFFPSQHLILSFPISNATVKVVRCNQIGKGCFDIGVRVVQDEMC